MNVTSQQTNTFFGLDVIAGLSIVALGMYSSAHLNMCAGLLMALITANTGFHILIFSGKYIVKDDLFAEPIPSATLSMHTQQIYMENTKENAPCSIAHNQSQVNSIADSKVT